MINLSVALIIMFSSSSAEITKSPASVEMAGFEVPSIRLSEYRTYFCITESSSQSSRLLINQKLYELSLGQGVKMKRNSPKIKYITIGPNFCGYIEKSK